MNDLFIPRINTKRMERFPLAYFAKLWNNLWQEIKDINSKSLFCNNLKEYFLYNLAGNVTCNRLLCPQCHLRPNSPTRINWSVYSILFYSRPCGIRGIHVGSQLSRSEAYLVLTPPPPFLLKPGRGSKYICRYQFWLLFWLTFRRFCIIFHQD